MALKWTEMRHEMLHQVAVDRDYEFVVRSKPTHGRFEHRGGFLNVAEKRALGDLLRAGLLSTETNPLVGSDDVDLTKSGRALLGDWDREHPRVSKLVAEA